MSSDLDYYVMAKGHGYYDAVLELRLREQEALEQAAHAQMVAEIGELQAAGREATKNIADPQKQHDAYLHYLRMRENGESHNMAVMASLGKSPAGYVH